MQFFLVDYETVGASGLRGISGLSEEDEVIVFYPNRAKPMSFELFRELKKAKANVSFQKVSAGGKTALNAHLCSYLGYLVGLNAKKSAACYVVSKNKHYETISSYWLRQNASVSVSVIPEISFVSSAISVEEASAPVENENDALQTEELQIKLKYLLPGKYETQIPAIADIIQRCPNRQDAHKELIKTLHDGASVAAADEIYRFIKPLLVSDREKLRLDVKRLFPDKDEHHIAVIAKAIRASQTKQAVRDELERLFGEEDESAPSEIYERIQPLLADKA